MHQEHRKYIEIISKFLHYIAFVFIGVAILSHVLAIYYVYKRQSEPIVTENIISSRYLLYTLNGIGIVIGVILMIILILGLINKFHEFDIFDENDLGTHKIVYVGIPSVIGFALIGIIALINIIFFISGIVESSNPENTYDGDNLILKPITHLAVNILILIPGILYTIFFAGVFVMRLIGK